MSNTNDPNNFNNSSGYNYYVNSASGIAITNPLVPTSSYGSLTSNKSYTINGNTYYWYEYLTYPKSGDCDRLQLYERMLSEERSRLDHTNIDNLNKMLESPDPDIVNFAVGVVKCNTKWLGLYLEAHYIFKDDYIKDIILDEYVKSKHAKL